MKSDLVSLKDLIQYLNENAWESDASFLNKNLLVFKKIINVDNLITIVLPSKEHFSDYPHKMRAALDTLSIVEGKDKQELVRQITSQDIDKLEIRIISSISEEGSIPLNYAAGLVKGLKNLIVSAAYTEEKPSKVFKRPSQQALNYGDLFKLGQTNVGSYIVTVESSSLMNDDIEIVFENNEARTESFSRRIIKRIHRSMYQIENFNKENFRLKDIVENGYTNGINANICEALLSMYQEGTPITLESRIKYSNAIEFDEELPATIVLKDADYLIIKTIAEALKSEEPESVEIEGNVSKLSILGESAYGNISVNFIHENRRHNVKVELEEYDYKLACDAHKNNKSVRIVGEMDTSKRTWEVLSLELFEVID
jgi:hypothetical protein